MKTFKNAFHRGYAGVAVATLISRIAGYIRDVLIAYFFGTSLLSDAFFVAFRIPNLLRRLLGEGALPAAFIPTYCGILADERKEDAQKFVGEIFAIFLLISLFVVGIGIIFAPQIIGLIAPGFSQSEKIFNIAILLSRIMFPILLFVNLATLSTGILNSRKIFFIPALAPAMMNFSIIFYFLFCMGKSPEKNITGLAVATGFGFLLHFLIMTPQLVREKATKLKYLFRKFSDPEVKKVLYLMLPAVVGVSVMQLNVFVDTICATLLGKGMVSALYYANRIYQLPFALFGVSVSIVALPFISDDVSHKKEEKIPKSLFNSLASSYFLIIPSTAGLMICAKDIVSILFKRGHFGISSVQTTAAVLFFYSIGLFALAGIRIFANYFYSLKDTKTPVKAASVAFLINIFLDVILMFPMGVAGLALATAISAFFNFAILGDIILRRGIKPDGKFLKSILNTLAATAIMSAFLLTVDVHILIKIPIAAVIYLLAAKILRSRKPHSTVQNL